MKNIKILIIYSKEMHILFIKNSYFYLFYSSSIFINIIFMRLICSNIVFSVCHSFYYFPICLSVCLCLSVVVVL